MARDSSGDACSGSGGAPGLAAGATKGGCRSLVPLRPLRLCSLRPQAGDRIRACRCTEGVRGQYPLISCPDSS